MEMSPVHKTLPYFLSAGMQVVNLLQENLLVILNSLVTYIHSSWLVIDVTSLVILDLFYIR